MVAEPLVESPLSPASGLGPCRVQDYLSQPDEPRCELIYGRFFLSPGPTPRHQTVLGLLWDRFKIIALHTGGFAAMAPLDVVLAEHSVVQPDVIYLAPGRRGLLGQRIEGAPDLLVEVVSPGTARRDRTEKLKLYAESGVSEYWIVDAEERQIEFLINREGRFIVALPLDNHYRSEVLPELDLDLAALWSEVDQLLLGRASGQSSPADAAPPADATPPAAAE